MKINRRIYLHENFSRDIFLFTKEDKKNCDGNTGGLLTALSPLSAEMSRKETAEKSRIRLWRSTAGTLMLSGRSAFQFIWKGRSLLSVDGSSFSVFSLKSVVRQNKSVKPLCETEVEQNKLQFVVAAVCTSFVVPPLSCHDRFSAASSLFS